MKDRIKNKTFKKFTITQGHKVEAERLAIKTMQLQCFNNEISKLKKGERIENKKLSQLKLYLDEHDIIRIHGRNQDEHFTRTNRPILFGYRHPLTILFIFSRHRCYNCSGVSYLLNKIRREIESPSLRRQIQETLSKCIVCRKILSRPFKYPENPPLNDYRTTCSRPFSMCGVDYVGPFPIYKNKEIDEITPNKKPKEPKTYVVLFTCLVSRAIYLVLVPDKKTETFLHAL